MIKFNNYNIRIDNNLLDITYKIEEDDKFLSVIIRSMGNVFMLSHNKLLDWDRLLINYSDGSWQDLPINNRTIGFLPEGVILIKA
jgi:hypothetical protein